MLLSKKAAILKWILPLILTKASGYMIVRFDNVNEKQFGNVLNHLQDSNAENILRFRKSTNARDYLNKKLVKRIVPHGYGIRNFEYDEKFKALYKPLIRIHKRKPVVNAFDDVDSGISYDLMFVLDDEHYKDVLKLAKDDSLLEPFGIDSTNIKYIQNNIDYDGHIKNSEKYVDHDHPGSNRYKLFDNMGKLKENSKNGDSYEAYAHLNPDSLKLFGSLKRFLRKQKDEIENDDYEQKNSNSLNKYKLLDQISKPYSNLNKRIEFKKEPTRGKAKKLHELNAVRQLASKQSQINEGNRIKLHAPNYIRSYEGNPTYNAYNYLNSINQLIRERNDVKPRQTKKENTNKRPKQWFGTVGQLYAKQLIKKDKNFGNSQDNPTEFKGGYFNSIRDTYNFPSSAKHLIARQVVEEPSDETNPIKDRLGPIRNTGKENNQNDNADEEIAELHNLFDPADVDKGREDKTIKGVETLKFNNFKLQKEIVQLKANSLENEEKEKENNSINENLRTKSGEQNEPMPSIVWDETPTTTEKSEAWMPSYPFWNYWTYEKSIYQDKCKGSLVQYGQLCVEPLF